MTSPDPEQVPGTAPRRSLYQLAKLWGVSQGEIFRAAQQLGIPSKMASTVNEATERRLENQLLSGRRPPRRGTGFPIGNPVNREPGADKSAYLAATARTARVEAAARVDEDLCSCCEVPLPQGQAASATVCQDCIRQGHRDLHGQNRDLQLARQHADRFRRAYLLQKDAVEQAHASRRATIERANRWTGLLVRLLVEHQPVGRCRRCRSEPCPLWRRAGLINQRLTVKIENDFYPLVGSALDRKLDDGVITVDRDDPDW